jgi:membrane associated rhomboid family serine protease
MSDSARNPDNYCYRHPDRQSFVLCQRCGRTICPECQTMAAVGVHCPECVKESQASMPRTKPAVVTSMRRFGGLGRFGRSGGPIVSYSIIGLSLLGFLVNLVPGVQSALVFYPPFAASEPWRFVTGIFVAGSILQLLFNAFSIFIFGPMLESMLGRFRFAALFLLGAFGGEVAVLLFAPGSIFSGMTGAIYGLLGAFVVTQRHLGGRSIQLYVIIAINVVLAIFSGAWALALGGLAVGALVGYAYVRTRNRAQSQTQLFALGGIFVALILLTVIGSTVLL